MNKIFKALNDDTRRKILHLLREKDRTAGEITAYFNISKPSISHHLAILKQANLVNSQRNGQFIYYSINTTVLDEIFEWLISLKENKRKK